MRIPGNQGEFPVVFDGKVTADYMADRLEESGSRAAPTLPSRRTRW
ncbi:MAG: hypothetical protein R3F19_32910 [Verrucomicrobiales bacterium]